MVEMACRNCRQIFDIPKGVPPICPNCKTATLTTEWAGLIVILDPEDSVVARELKATRPGRYAIKVGR